jgi:hypothetical protein
VIASDIDKRVSLALAVRRYQSACENYERASAEFQEACQTVRSHFEKNARYVVCIDYRHWLIETDSSGDFSIESIEVL